MKPIEPIIIGGKEVYPLIEGGKGIAITSGESSGAWAAAGGIGTVSATNADSYDDDGRVIPQEYEGRTRRERHDELIAYAIQGGIAQVCEAYERAGGNGAINVNVLWEAAATVDVLKGVLEGAKGLVDGVTCGAGMPYQLAQICASYGVYYYPIVSSARAFRALWRRSYHKVPEYLAAVVYEDPWLAGGHNGLSNSEDPKNPQEPYPRVRELRAQMNEYGLNNVPIIMAGGVWFLREWEDWIDNPEVAPVAFQFGTRPLLTRESPISDEWKEKLVQLEKGDVLLHRFSPTGFYSSAVRNDFLRELEERNDRQVPYEPKPNGGDTVEFNFGPRGRVAYLKPCDKQKAEQWVEEGYTEALKTPDSTLIFVTPEKAREIHRDQAACMGCLSACLFSNWSQGESGSTGRKADPRSFCIQKTLQNIAHGAPVDHELMFSGHNAYRFAEDPFYANGFIPTVKELVERIRTGD